MPTHYTTCSLCEANCGLQIETDGPRVLSIRGDRADDFSKGHICPKAAALTDLHEDPDRLRAPVRRVESAAGEVSWQELGWAEALSAAAEGLAAVRTRHGQDALAVYVGNPTVHNYSALLGLQFLLKAVPTRSYFSANSVDGLPRLLTSATLYGNQARLPIPDIERTEHLLILGANPLVSNGSIMTAPGIKRRLAAIRARGGRVVVIDPRRTETAAVADAHHFIRPGTDGLLLAAMVHTVFKRGWARPRQRIEGLDVLRARLASFTPKRVAAHVGIDAETILALTREFAEARSAVCYARLGTCVQAFGTLSSWLVDALNILTGNMDHPGGAMFPTPAVDLADLADKLGQAANFGRWRSRVSGLPEFNGELPVAAMAEEMETPGIGQVRGLLLHAGNPVLSTPDGLRLERAIAELDFVVAIDPYINETTRHADLILPPLSPLERDHFGLVFNAVAVRNVAKWSPRLFEPPKGRPQSDYALIRQLTAAILRKEGKSLRALGVGALLSAAEPDRVLGLLMRMGPQKVTMKQLAKAPHGLDLGPLEPGRLGDLIIDLAPVPFVEDLDRLEACLEQAPPELLLIGRRTLRSNNSWMHNSQRLVKGRSRCTLRMHPEDAKARGLESGQTVSLVGPAGRVEAPLEVSDEVMLGVVSLPHGWGHGREGTRLNVAATKAGVSVNDVLAAGFVDALSGASVLNGVPVEVV